MFQSLDNKVFPEIQALAGAGFAWAARFAAQAEAIAVQQYIKWQMIKALAMELTYTYGIQKVIGCVLIKLLIGDMEAKDAPTWAQNGVTVSVAYGEKGTDAFPG